MTSQQQQLFHSTHYQHHAIHERNAMYDPKHTIQRSTSYSLHTSGTHMKEFNAIFSDDEDETPNMFPQSLKNSSGLAPLSVHPPVSAPQFADPPLSSAAYYIHQADIALSTLKHVVKESGWKKALKHKSGVVVHMKNGTHKADKTAIFKGEMVIEGFSPQSIFYVIGLRRLWDEQYEDGNLVDNLDETTSLTYESNKPTSTSKARDLSLVERIECTSSGAIVFACTSVESPRIPRMPGCTRAQVKLQGWILEPMYFGHQPSTKVTFVIQENMKGWIPGFAKKTLARRPLVIALVNDYLQKKAERARIQKKPSISFLSPATYSRKSTVTSTLPIVGSAEEEKEGNYPNSQQLLHLNTNENFNTLPASFQRPILMGSGLSLPSSPKKHIKFVGHGADNDLERTLSLPSPGKKPSYTDSRGRILDAPGLRPVQPSSNRHLYPVHRHASKRAESISLLKNLTSPSLKDWTLQDDRNNIKTYYFNGNINQSYFVRTEHKIKGEWSAEQLCSLVQCYGTRQTWDGLFDSGRVVDRFSQKEHLVHWFLNKQQPEDIAAITTIDTDPILNTVYIATTSVVDQQIPEDTSGHYKRTHIQLYGWSFLPDMDDNGKTHSITVSLVYSTNESLPLPLASLDHSHQCIEQLCNYLENIGCPPYVRRVAGKVIEEEFLSDIRVYTICYIVKHKPSNSYSTRKGNTLDKWCTEIRFDKDMFPSGIDIRVTPSEHTRTEIGAKRSIIRIYTTDPIMEGKQLRVLLSSQEKAINGTAKDSDLSVNTSRSNSMMVDHRLSFVSALSVFTNPEIEQMAISVNRTIVKSESTVFEKHSTPSTPLSQPPLSLIATTPEKQIEYNSGIVSNTKSKDMPMNIPEGYMLVPRHQVKL
ncbi:hypothetical protein BDF14DRAFT_1804698 [Spinellus fusiger]|nr:hypothetical protein BDF14DRAFT_1804698 [Spinellus fusiger]